MMLLLAVHKEEESCSRRGLQLSFITLSPGALQGCVLSPVLYTHDCTPAHPKFAITQLLPDSAYRDESLRLSVWCPPNNLSLNITKTKELILDFRRKRDSESAEFI